MAKIKIQGNASGTGTLTLTAPNTNADRTITLPDGTGELIQANASGNVGIGNTTNNWENTAPVTSLDIGQGGKSSLFDYDSLTGNTQTILLNNSYYNSGYKYVGAGESSQYQQADGAHTFSSAPTGVADASMTNTVQMKIDSAGRVTMPYQPAFKAGTSSGFTCTSDYADIAMPSTHLNVGNHYSTTSSRFTAPIAGTYHFSFSGNTKNANPAWASFKKNNSRSSLPILYNAGSTGWTLISGSCTIYLNQGDYVSVGGVNNSYWDSSTWTSFSGHLIG